MSDSISGKIAIASENDIVTARRVVRKAAESLGFGLTDVTRLVTATSELAHNIFCHAGAGYLLWIGVQDPERRGLELRFIDEGPGIMDIEQAMQPGFSTRNRHGMGLTGAKLLVDELTIASQAGKGTTVTVRKWRPIRSLSGATTHE